MTLMSVPLFGIDSNLVEEINIPKACMVSIKFRIIYSHFVLCACTKKSKIS